MSRPWEVCRRGLPAVDLIAARRVVRGVVCPLRHSRADSRRCLSTAAADEGLEWVGRVTRAARASRQVGSIGGEGYVAAHFLLGGAHEVREDFRGLERHLHRLNLVEILELREGRPRLSRGSWRGEEVNEGERLQAAARGTVIQYKKWTRAMQAVNLALCASQKRLG